MMISSSELIPTKDPKPMTDSLTIPQGSPLEEPLPDEMEALRARLEEAEDTLQAIRQGEVDALVVSETHGEKVYTLQGADRPYRLMIEEMGQGAVTLLPEGTILYCNRCFAGLVDAHLESVLGTSIYSFLAPASLEPFETLLRQGETKGRGQGEVQLRTVGGGLVPAYAAVTALSREEGPALCLVITDLTGQRAAAKAEAANEAKDRFLANLSHELRTPLTPVLAVVSGLEGDPRLPDDVRVHLGMMRRNLELEARLIDDMLDLTRIERGKLELRRESSDLCQILEHALQTTERDLLTKRLRVVTELITQDCVLSADTPRLTQVFWNLFHNAAKFTPEGGTIVVRSTKEQLPGEACCLVVEVRDTGMGIEPETLEHIFDAFDQGRPGTARRFGGLGLGLAISKAIVEMHGGTLTAFSGGRNQGATFTVRLPWSDVPAVAARAAADAARTAREPALSTKAEGQSHGSNPHLLLIEDHADTAEAMAELLRDLGYRITLAGSVSAGLAAAERAQASLDGGRIDLVVSDLGLPDGSGLDLMRALSSRYGLRGIALSGYGMDEDIQKSREAGFQKHVTKPVSLQALQSALQDALG
jgi:signal transduction histidine kinase/ActR/RegA family two-component response regulator